VYDNGGNGIYSEGSAEVTIRNSNSYSNNYGIHLYATPDSSIINCNVYDNIAHGIYILHSPNTEVVNCTLHSNGYDGVCISSSTYCDILDCEVYENQKIGIYIINSDCSNNNIENCNSYNDGFDSMTPL